MLKRRQALFAIGGALAAGQFGRAAGPSGTASSIQIEMGIAVGELRNSLAARSGTQPLTNLCDDLALRCRQVSRVSPAWAQATLDACQRQLGGARSENDNKSIMIESQLRRFSFAVRRYIEVVAA